MNVTFEHTTVVYDDKIAEVLIGFVNHILIAYNEETLRRLVADYTERTAFDKYFVYGYGRNHLWVSQKKITDPEKVFNYRILIVKF
ncbi:hypothetical protein [Bacteroides acidifaciens]|uniref:hypothetical protein n=1 Tax=Bacteroides acidifaciens TaxID=85831 RepID=UPI0026ECE5CE|nr:hypothetical protein [Bacteroides acidifaciens]